MTRQYLTLPTVLLVLGLSAGCDTTKGYDGPDLAEEKLAFVLDSGRLDVNLFVYRSTVLRKIDGKNVDSYFGIGRIAVLPGQHTVTFDYEEWIETIIAFPMRTHSLENAGTLTFDARAGHEYVALSDRRKDRFWSWIKDTTTGETVGGQKPPDSHKAYRRASREGPNPGAAPGLRYHPVPLYVTLGAGIQR